MVDRNEVLKYITDEYKVSDIRQALVNLRIYAKYNRNKKIIAWCENELNGYVDDSNVPLYRIIGAEDWFIELIYDSGTGVVNKRLILSDLVSAKFSLSGDSLKKINIIIDILKDKKLIIKHGFVDLESYPNKVLGEIHSSILEYIAKVAPVEPYPNVIIYPQDAKFLCNDDNAVRHKIKQSVQEKIKIYAYELKDKKSIIPKVFSTLFGVSILGGIISYVDFTDKIVNITDKLITFFHWLI